MENLLENIKLLEKVNTFTFMEDGVKITPYIETEKIVLIWRGEENGK